MPQIDIHQRRSSVVERRTSAASIVFVDDGRRDADAGIEKAVCLYILWSCVPQSP
jgi:hypothetical protein